MLPRRELHFYRITLMALALLLAWDASGWDLAAARIFGDGRGFALNGHWLASTVLHAGARNLNYVLVLVLAFFVWRPVGVLRRMTLAERALMLAGLLAALASVALLKHFSATSCPWDLSEFGGTTPYVSHWRWKLGDGGPGRCFPAGHASVGFAWFAVYFGLQRKAPRAALCMAAAALAFGMLLGLAQQARGAHFMSHTLWSGWICWTASGLVYALSQRWSGFRRGAATSIVPAATPR